MHETEDHLCIGDVRLMRECFGAGGGDGGRAVLARQDRTRSHHFDQQSTRCDEGVECGAQQLGAGADPCQRQIERRVVGECVEEGGLVIIGERQAGELCIEHGVAEGKTPALRETRTHSSACQAA